MKFVKIFLTIIFLSACSEPNKNDIGYLPDFVNKGCYILCEGLFGQNNSSLTLLDFETNQVINNYFFKKNNIKIGDTANDILISGDTSFIVVSTNNKIIAFNTKTGLMIKEIISDKLKTPRKIVKLNDSLFAITNLKNNSVTFLNSNKLEILDKVVVVGPAPEGIAVCDKHIFVANSGYGDYLSNQADAGTIYVIDKNTLSLITKFKNLPNVIQLEFNRVNNRLYARYNNLPSLKDSLGGIVEFDVDSLKEIRRWKLKVYYITINSKANSIYYLNDYGIGKIELTNGSINNNFIKKQSSNEVWYSIISCQIDEKLYVTNAKNYQTLGELIIFNPNDSIFIPIKYNVGLNPNIVVFF